ncbi:MAG: uracil-DNA glycosylase family protein, partial [Thermoanaerobaculia bacterium]
MRDGDFPRDELEFFRDLGVTDVYLDPASAGAPSLVPGSLPDMPALQKFVAGCPRCKLSKTRTNIVFGQGNPKAELMFVGEAPGRDEDEQGLAFVGKAGQLLTKIIEAMGKKREDVWICNVLKCLRYNAPVQLGDGSWERIGRLVRRRYDGAVMSVDATGRLTPRRVIGWHATPLAGRRVFRLTYRSAKRAGLSPIGIQLTGEHPVLTDRGYVPVDRLEPGARIATGQGLSPLARDVVWGTLLGDGDLPPRSSHLFFAHSAAQIEYAAFKAEWLQELRPRIDTLAVAAVSGGEKVYPVVHVRTVAHRALRILRREFYRPKKRVPPSIAGRLNDRTLAVWFLDDGHLRIGAGHRPDSEIATCGYGENDLEILLRELDRVGLPARARRGRLFFDSSTTFRFSQRIAPYVPASMRYKLHPEVALRIPFDSSRFERGAPEVLYDEVDLEDVSDRHRSDTTFFCIDVEETHNFVTSGGVVHNCRPPNNRNPEADEVASCLPFLEEQIRLISPRVIVTLGTFAAQAILETDEPIGQMRGRWQHSRGVRIMPTFHPAFLLR